MINDLDANGVSLWKYVDDLTITEVVPKGLTSDMQTTVNSIHIASLSTWDSQAMNEDKCKEMKIHFSKAERHFSPLTINNKELDLVNQVKVSWELLLVTIWSGTVTLTVL